MSSHRSNSGGPFTPRAPEKSFRFKGFTVSLFRAQDYEGRPAYRFGFSTGYKDKVTGEWKETKTTPDWMLPTAIEMITKAHNYVHAMQNGHPDPYPNDSKASDFRNAPLPASRQTTPFDDVPDFGVGGVEHSDIGSRNVDATKIIQPPEEDDYSDIPF